MAIHKERLIEVLEQLPEEKIIKVLNFAESLNRNKEKKKIFLFSGQ